MVALYLEEFHLSRDAAELQHPRTKATYESYYRLALLTNAFNEAMQLDLANLR